MARLSLMAVVLLVCAGVTCASSQPPRPQRDQYPGREDPSSTSNGLDPKKNRSDNNDEVEPLPVRHHRQTKGHEKSKGKAARNRNYRLPWMDSVESLPPTYYYSSWTPATYTLNRPYFIPAWGAAGSVPIYFPPQPLLMNPGYPPRNPPKGYLPPYENPPTTTTSGPATMPVIDNRIGDDAPVWDMEEAPGAVATAPKPTRIVPTRRPQAGPSTSTFPPVLHRPQGGGGSGVNSLTVKEGEENKVVAGAPINTPPGRCVWAIISCCSDAAEDVVNSCFDSLGCSGPFWDRSPCESEFAKVAINAALEYYKTG